MNRSIFINLPVRDLDKSKLFMSKLGFEFNPKFTDAKAACMVVNSGAYVMLLTEPFFQGFTTKQQCDTQTSTETLVCYSVGSRAEVDTAMERAIAGGGREAMPAQDHGFMYGRSFYDLDGHHWEVMWMDPAAVG
jgi:hypothetical protein